jgi:hypothetical protein
MTKEIFGQALIFELEFNFRVNSPIAHRSKLLRARFFFGKVRPSEGRWVRNLFNCLIFFLFATASFASAPERLDLLVYGRELAKKEGMEEATRKIFEMIHSQDHTAGRVERDFIFSGIDCDYCVPNALQKIPQEDRHRVGFFFINGLLQNENSFSTKICRRSIEVLESEGFGAEMVMVSPEAGTAHNARLIAEALRGALPRFDRIYITSISKGTKDLIHALTDYRSYFDREQFKKVESIVSLSGAIRPSALSDWFKNSKRPLARLTRQFIANPIFGAAKTTEGILALAEEPEFREENLELLRIPHWINIVAFPVGAKGYPSVSFFENLIMRSMLRAGVPLGPYDGLIETAASIFPPGLGVRQSIVRTFGPHGGVEGRFFNGQDVLRTLKAFDKKKKVFVADELIRRCLRVLSFTGKSQS